ncbi:MAG: UPF0182 family protein [Anaerolineae bacterium]
MSRRMIAVLLLVALFLALTTSVGRYTDWLWFGSLGFQPVYLTRLAAQAGLFLAGGLVFLACFAINVALAGRLARRAVGLREHPGSEMVRTWEGTFRLALVGGGLFLAFTLAGSAGAAWEVVLRYLNATPFGTADPLFGRDVAFFVFTLPLHRFVQGWLMGLVALTLLAAAAVYVFRVILPQLPPGSMETIEQLPPVTSSLALLTRPIMAHLSLLAAASVLLMAWGYRLDIYELVFSTRSAAYGAGYTDVNARWLALNLLTGLAVLVALLLLVNVFRRGWRLPLAGVALWVVASFLVGGLYPGFVQRFQVQPQELDRERPYIERNIRLTRQAYALDRIQEVPLPGEEMVTPQEIVAHPDTVRNIRLWDPEPLLDTYNQLQSIRLYYDFVGVDVDRYAINGQYRQVMLSARELAPEQLPAEAQTWVNRRLQFTHGFGVAMSPVNELTPEGLPTFFVQDVPPRGELSIPRSEIYHGEKTEGYVIVRTRTPEFSYPRGEENVYTTYQGEIGVGVGSFLRRLLFAVRFGDINILLSDALQPDSLVLYHRNIQERMEKIAPFLLLDRDPYLVVADGQLYWIQDAYTHSDRYPYAQPIGEGGAFNYLRNSVKAVISAYDGAVTLYIADPEDPIIRAWAGIFPDLFRPLEDLPPALRAHLRYPKDLFVVQAELYRTYHMQDPRVFYNKEDLWTIPNEIYLDRTVPMEPYYVITRLPGEPREEFVLIRPYTPPNKNNMITWLAARSDGEHYGKLLALRYPKDRLVFGPMQVEARIDQDPAISEQLTLWGQAGSQVLRGNMIVIPVGQSNLYVEPIYLQAEAGRLPEMKRVVLASGNRVVMEPTVETGLARLFGPEAVAAAPETPPAEVVVELTAPATPPDERELDVAELMQVLQKRYARIQEEMKALEADLQRLSELLGAEPQ